MCSRISAASSRASTTMGFTTRRATEQDLKRMLGVYFEQNVTTEKFEGLRRRPLGHRGRVNQFITGRGGVPLHGRDALGE